LSVASAGQVWQVGLPGDEVRPVKPVVMQRKVDNVAAGGSPGG
jgi:hypothetical protein